MPGRNDSAVKAEGQKELGCNKSHGLYKIPGRKAEACFSVQEQREQKGKRVICLLPVTGTHTSKQRGQVSDKTDTSNCRNTENTKLQLSRGYLLMLENTQAMLT